MILTSCVSSITRGFLGSPDGPVTVAGGVGTAGAWGSLSTSFSFSLSFSMCVFSTTRSLSVAVSLETSRSRAGLRWLWWLWWPCELRPGLRPRSLGA